ncbi:MAG TPA: methylenetetrahydrofolate--tRNA-(uracil(54)-C(5))-methyltransferase (FADH(2)-oxidizing) TrmFO [Candidatus Limnocylindria bacterium]|nr:methylenetetrahydrofolate--tRNA-(uracil(54)-C(5))-methyltransferase (FADH(2)-oxidizing) TrmFO [Candidatus Limnocylindria bacterium]
MTRVTVVGGGLAGVEAACQLAAAGVGVDLYEMRPVRGTPAHHTDRLGELVCSNSLRNATLDTAVGLLKEEMRRLGSVVLRVAEQHRVPAGACLAVDRVGFAEALTALVEATPGIRLVREEVTSLPDGLVVLATGPLTSPALSEELAGVLGSRHLYFYDAIAPTVAAESIDMTIAWKASRWEKGGDDYINCPLDRAQYDAFVAAVLAAEKVPSREFERCIYFEGCMPIEEMARRGHDTLAYGPMRPVGLVDPRTGRRPHACVQLRQDDAAGTLYNMVGFQTKMTYPEQRRVLRMIPGLERAEFVRLGSLHRNTYVNAPELLLPSLQVRRRRTLLLAGQIVGVEGYVESAAMGILAGMNAARLLHGQRPVVPPATTALGSLVAYVTQPGRKDFQPMNANYGLFPPLPEARKGREKKRALAERALADLARWQAELAPSGIASSVA